jgi:superfamily II DNA or RNA helicase/HKD family nuclease
MTRQIEKLVRDNIPSALTNEEQQKRHRIATRNEEHRFLARKWAEEADELLAEFKGARREQLIEEMADVYEVLNTIADRFNITQEEVQRQQLKKQTLKGGFKENRLLKVPLKNTHDRWLLGHNSAVLPFLNWHIQHAIEIKIAVSFILESGLRLLEDSLKIASANGCKISLLTTTYLHVTEPAALKRLLSMQSDNFKVRLYENKNQSFHPKTWIFTDQQSETKALVGSSNISASALMHGVEWNYHIHETDAGWPVEQASQIFDELFFSTPTEPLTQVFVDTYTLSYEPKPFKETRYAPTLTPNPAQLEALQRLQLLREDGENKAMVIAATGVGKTYLAAFDSLKYSKVLFLAHRIELLTQAEKSFLKIRPNDGVCRMYSGEATPLANLTFATAQSLGTDQRLESLSETQFDYIVVDEFHHAAADGYLKILTKLKPKFLLGLTATPYRMDNRELLNLCDDNIAYKVMVHDAIAMGWLCPFRYYGLYDDTDYAKLQLHGGQYRIADIEATIVNEKRNRQILEQFRRFPSRCAIGFCVSKAHADNMATYFLSQGIESRSYHSDNSHLEANGLSLLRQGEIRILFVVDMLNEGVDIPAVDLVMFLRPTQSMTIFLQQLGRGLRRHETKNFLTVLDFIGNYKGADFKLPTLLGDYDKKDDLREDLNVSLQRLNLAKGLIELPGDIRIELDELSLKTLKALHRQPIHEQLKQAFMELKDQLSRRPTLSDLFNHGRYAPKLYRETFGSFMQFLLSTDQATEQERELEAECGGFLLELEKTAMTKSYKMVVIQSLLKRQGFQDGLDINNIVSDFRDFFTSHLRHQVDTDDTVVAEITHVKLETLKRYVKSNPIDNWCNGSFFKFDESRSLMIYVGPQPSNWHTFYQAVDERQKWRIAAYFERKIPSLPKFRIVCGRRHEDQPHIAIGNFHWGQEKPLGWQRIVVGEETYFANFVKIAINVLKIEPSGDKVIQNQLADVLMKTLGVTDKGSLNGKFVSIERLPSCDGFSLGAYKPE